MGELEDGLVELDDFLIFEGDNVDEVKHRQLNTNLCISSYNGSAVGGDSASTLEQPSKKRAAPKKQGNSGRGRGRHRGRSRPPARKGAAARAPAPSKSKARGARRQAPQKATVAEGAMEVDLGQMSERQQLAYVLRLSAKSGDSADADSNEGIGSDADKSSESDELKSSPSPSSSSPMLSRKLMGSSAAKARKARIAMAASGRSAAASSRRRDRMDSGDATALGVREEDGVGVFFYRGKKRSAKGGAVKGRSGGKSVSKVARKHNFVGFVKGVPLRTISEDSSKDADSLAGVKTSRRERHDVEDIDMPYVNRPVCSRALCGATRARPLKTKYSLYRIDCNCVTHRRSLAALAREKRKRESLSTAASARGTESTVAAVGTHEASGAGKRPSKANSAGKSTGAGKGASSNKGGQKRKRASVDPPPTKEEQTEEAVVDIDEDETFQVESILDRRTKGGRVEYFVKWEGYDSAHNTWEPESSFYSSKILRQYERNRKARERRAARKAAVVAKSDEEAVVSKAAVSKAAVSKAVVSAPKDTSKTKKRGNKEQSGAAAATSTTKKQSRRGRSAEPPTVASVEDDDSSDTRKRRSQNTQKKRPRTQSRRNGEDDTASKKQRKRTVTADQGDADEDDAISEADDLSSLDIADGEKKRTADRKHRHQKRDHNQSTVETNGPIYSPISDEEVDATTEMVLRPDGNSEHMPSAGTGDDDSGSEISDCDSFSGNAFASASDTAKTLAKSSSERDHLKRRRGSKSKRGASVTLDDARLAQVTRSSLLQLLAHPNMDTVARGCLARLDNGGTVFDGDDGQVIVLIGTVVDLGVEEYNVGHHLHPSTLAQAVTHGAATPAGFTSKHLKVTQFVGPVAKMGRSTTVVTVHKSVHRLLTISDEPIAQSEFEAWRRNYRALVARGAFKPNGVVATPAACSAKGQMVRGALNYVRQQHQPSQQPLRRLPIKTSRAASPKQRRTQLNANQDSQNSLGKSYSSGDGTSAAPASKHPQQHYRRYSSQQPSYRHSSKRHDSGRARGDSQGTGGNEDKPDSAVHHNDSGGGDSYDGGGAQSHGSRHGTSIKPEGRYSKQQQQHVPSKQRISSSSRSSSYSNGTDTASGADKAERFQESQSSGSRYHGGSGSSVPKPSYRRDSSSGSLHSTHSDTDASRGTKHTRDRGGQREWSSQRVLRAPSSGPSAAPPSQSGPKPPTSGSQSQPANRPNGWQSWREQHVGSSVFVSNIPSDTETKALVEVFKRFGSVTNVHILPQKPGTCRTRLAGFVDFDETTAASKALKSAGRLAIDEVTLRIDVKRGKPPKASATGPSDSSSSVSSGGGWRSVDQRNTRSAGSHASSSRDNKPSPPSSSSSGTSNSVTWNSFDQRSRHEMQRYGSSRRR